jgi:DNA-binding protein Fis
MAKLIDAMEQASDIVQDPPLDDGARHVVTWFKGLSPDAVKGWLREMIASSEQQLPPFDDVKRDPALLQRLLDQYGGKKARLARMLKVDPATLHRVLKKHRQNAAALARKKRSSRSASRPSARAKRSR